MTVATGCDSFKRVHLELVGVVTGLFWSDIGSGMGNEKNGLV